MALHGAETLRRNLRRLSRHVVPERMAAFTRALVIQAGNDLVTLTPVDFGQARGGWDLGVGRPPQDIARRNDPSGRGAIARIRSIAKTLPPFSSAHLANFVRHAQILDEGGFVPPNPGPSSDPRPGRFGRVLVSGGYSVQAPRGMVRKTLRNLNDHVRRALAAATREVPSK